MHPKRGMAEYITDYLIGKNDQFNTDCKCDKLIALKEPMFYVTL